MAEIEQDEFENFTDTEYSDNVDDEKDIYEDGKLFRIKIEELKNNEIAIKQLVNSNNSSKKELKRIQEENNKKEIEIGLLKISSFISVISIVINVISTVILGVGINVITSLSGNNDSKIGAILLCCGVLGSIVGNALPIIYPHYSKKIR